MSARNINETQFWEMLQAGKPMVVDFWAPWCSYCRRIGPAYDQIAAQYGDKLDVVKLNIDDAGALADGEGIEVIPTLVVYREGRAVSSVTAPGSKAAIDAFLREALGE